MSYFLLNSGRLTLILMVRKSDGSEGILLRTSELEEIEAKRQAGAEAMRKFLKLGKGEK